MLLSVASLALLLKSFPVDVELFVLAVLLPLIVIRLPRGRQISERAMSFAVMALMSVLAVALPSLLDRSAVVGTVLLILTAAASKWMRGRSRALAMAGVGAGLVVRIALITPPPHGETSEPTRAVLAIAVAVLCYAWVGILDRLIPRKTAPRKQVSHPQPAHPDAELMAENCRNGTLQMLLAVACSCVIGRILFTDHWTWSALSAFLVLNGTWPGPKFCAKACTGSSAPRPAPWARRCSSASLPPTVRPRSAPCWLSWRPRSGCGPWLTPGGWRA
jgi:hypothetical protein